MIPLEMLQGLYWVLSLIFKPYRCSILHLSWKEFKMQRPPSPIMANRQLLHSKLHGCCYGSMKLSISAKLVTMFVTFSITISHFGPNISQIL